MIRKIMAVYKCTDVPCRVHFPLAFSLGACPTLILYILEEGSCCCSYGRQAILSYLVPFLHMIGQANFSLVSILLLLLAVLYIKIHWLDWPGIAITVWVTVAYCILKFWELTSEDVCPVDSTTQLSEKGE